LFDSFQHLADVFTGLRIYLPESVEKYKELRRYIIAFDGELIKEYDVSNATHIVADDDVKNGHDTADAIPSVTTDWLWSCIREKKVVPLGTRGTTEDYM
jgi:DNA ligase-3